MRIVLFLLLAFLSFDCMADIDGCRPMSKKESDSVLPKIRQAFVDAHRFPLDEVDISPGRDCGSDIYFVIEAKPGYANFGYHWIVTLYKESGRIEVENGM